MKIGNTSLQLVSQLSGLRSGNFAPGQQGIAALASRFGAARAGLSEARFEPTFESQNRARLKERLEVQQVTETRDVMGEEAIEEIREVYSQRDIFEERTRYVSRDVMETQDVFETRDVMGEEAIEEMREVYSSRDIVEQRTRYVSRDIMETRDVFETRDIVAARVEGSRSLAGANNLYQAGISIGSGFTVETADGGKVEVKFDSYSSLRVKVGKETAEIQFNAIDGSFKQALVDGLNASGVVGASWNADGKLVLSDASAMTIKSVGGSSALNALGIAAGRTDLRVIGTEQVKTGTESVKVGTEMVADGTEQVVVGTERYVSGSESVVVGTRQVKIGEERVKVGTENVKIGTQMVADGTEQVVVGSEQFLSGTERVVVGTRQVKVGEEQIVTGTKTVKVTAVDDNGVAQKLLGLERMQALAFRSDSGGATGRLGVNIVDLIAKNVSFGERLSAEDNVKDAYEMNRTEDEDEDEEGNVERPEMKLPTENGSEDEQKVATLDGWSLPLNDLKISKRFSADP